MSSEMSFGQVETFETLPQKRNSGGGRRSELLEHVRQLQPNQKIDITLNDEEGNPLTGDEFNVVAKRRAQSLYAARKNGRLAFRPRISTNPETSQISVFNTGNTDEE